jgi:hypothetical protein
VDIFDISGFFYSYLSRFTNGYRRGNTGAVSFHDNHGAGKAADEDQIRGLPCGHYNFISITFYAPDIYHPPDIPNCNRRRQKTV